MNKIRYYENFDLAIINGYKFRRDKRTGYYLSSSSINGKRRRLHVYVWELNNGQVPKGYQVHHIDENKYNNEIENLILLSRNKHLSLHGKENIEKFDRLDEHLKEIRKKATEWHKSKEGREWHKKHYEKCKNNFIKVEEFQCECCGKRFIGKANGKNKFCSNKCKSKYRRNTGIDNIIRECLFCGKEFTVNKYAKRKYCSKECSYKAVPRGGNTNRNKKH